jgi:hypothetical protein
MAMKKRTTWILFHETLPTTYANTWSEAKEFLEKTEGYLAVKSLHYY